MGFCWLPGDAGVQGSIQGADPRKSHPALGVFDEQAPEHPELVGDPGVHDGVIDVADDHIPATGRRDEDLRLRLNRLGLLQSQIHRVPQAIERWRQGRGEMDPEIAVLVSGEGLFRPVEPGCSGRMGNGAAGNAPANIAQVSEEVVSSWSPRKVSTAGTPGRSGTPRSGNHSRGRAGRPLHSRLAPHAQAER